MNWEKVREQFPVTNDYLFFDLANKCALPLFSTNVIKEYIGKQQRNGGSKDEWFETLEEARANFATFINAHPDEIAFTKNTSEGLNIAANCIPLQAGDTVLLNENEHPNNIYCWLNLEKKGVKVRWIPTSEGGVSVEALAKLADETTKVVSISSTTYSPGNRNDIKAIVDFCKPRGIYTVVDAVQSVGTLELDVQALGMDILCTSGHKSLFCPHGVGVIYVRRGLLDKVEPLYVARAGMGMAAQIEYDTIEYKLNKSTNATKYEIGNYNYLGITVLNESLKYLMSLGMKNVEAHLMDLSAYFINCLQAAGYEIAGPTSGPLRSAILCFKAENARELHQFLMENKAITTLRRDMIRVSLGIYNNEEDIDKFMLLLSVWEKKHLG